MTIVTNASLQCHCEGRPEAISKACPEHLRRNEIPRGVYPESFIETLRYAQNDKRRRARNNKR
jgi:hypothetical protein